jgi:DNA-binding protein Fis
LTLADGNRERAASMLGMSRTTLWRKMKTYDMSADTTDG